MNQKNSPPACILFLILLIGFLVFYTGIPGTDDEQLFASAAQSYSLTGRFTADQVYGNKRLQGYYASIAPLHAWIGALTYRLAEKLQTGGLQCFFLLSPFYSACTGYLLAKIGQRRGFSQKTILYSIIIFGFGTLVFAYSKSYFREPLAMLLITTAYYEMDSACVEQPGSIRYTLRIISALVFLVLAIWTKEFLIACVPGLIYCFVSGMHKYSSEFLPRKSKVSGKSSKYLWLAILLLIIILGALFLKDRSGRFSISYLSRLWTYFPLLNHAHFFESLWRVFFSLSKGFVVYSPILWLVLLSPIYRKKANIPIPDFVLALSSALGVAILQVFFYDAEWWTFTWSTRFMLPVLPFWIICLFPLVEKLLQTKNRWQNLLGYSFLIFSLWLQMGSVLISSADYAQFLWDRYHFKLSEINVAHIEAIPAVGHWLAFSQGVISDVSWIRIFLSGNLWVVCIPLVLGLLFVLSLLIYMNWSKINQKLSHWIYPLMALISLLLPMITLFGNKDDPYYAGTQSAYRDSAKVLSQNIAEKDLVAVDFYNQPIWYFYFNFGFNHSNWIGLPPPHFSMSGKLAIYPEMQETITYLLGIKNPTSKIWLITEKKEIIEEMNYASALQQAGLSIHSAQTFYHKGQYPLVRLIEFDPEE